ncbi:MAG: hypothetical protein O2930_11460 [Acidobacteria bacterium]|nr:hypothetical protein [Acidobacteriota bacterium]
MRKLFLIGLLLAGAGAAVYAVVRSTDPRPAYVHVHWNTTVDESARRTLERTYSLERPRQTEGLPYTYALTDLSRTNIQALVENPAVEDTQNIHRTRFRPGLFTPRLPYPTWAQAWMAVGLTLLSAGLLLAGGVATVLASVAGLRTLRIPKRMQVHVAAGGACIGTWLIRFLALTGFPNDHFLYLAPAQQMLAGEWPSRDFVDPGTPLMYVVSFVAQLFVDSPLLAEALVVSTAFGLAAALTVYAAFAVSGSLSIAVAVTAAEVALFPRSYHYPKLLFLAAGVLAMWRYARDPSFARTAVLAGCIAVTFLFRHDLAVYLGIAALTTVLFAHSGWTTRARGTAQILGLVALLLAPYLWYVEATVGLSPHIASGAEYSRSEIEETSFIRSAPFALVRLPTFELSTMLSADNALASLFYLFHILPLLAIGVLVWRRAHGIALARSDLAMIVPLIVLAAIANFALLRRPLQGRLPDVAVPVCLLAAWLIPQAWRCGGTRRFISRALVLTLTGVAIAGVNATGAPMEQLNRAGLLSRPDHWLAHARQVVMELQEPISLRQIPSRYIEALVPFLGYVDRCTSPDQRLFVAGNAPEIYVFARRLFAGGQPMLRAGFYSTTRDQRLLIQKMRTQDVPLALVLPQNDVASFTLVMDELENAFRPAGEIPVEGIGSILVRVNRRARPHGVDVVTGLPCFQQGLG